MKILFDELYSMLSEQADNDPQYRKEWKATKAASLAVLEELEERCGEKCGMLLEVLTSLDSRMHCAHEQALLRTALQLGMELGRISVS